MMCLVLRVHFRGGAVVAGEGRRVKGRGCFMDIWGSADGLVNDFPSEEKDSSGRGLGPVKDALVGGWRETPRRLEDY